MARCPTATAVSSNWQIKFGAVERTNCKRRFSRAVSHLHSSTMTQELPTPTRQPDLPNGGTASRSKHKECPCGEALDKILNNGIGATDLRVNFRELVTCFRYGERITHSVHPYPAKLLPHIPHFLLSHPDLLPEKGVVGDPFCGSGTVLLETALVGKHAWGLDCNPLATLISQVKTTPIEPSRIARGLQRIRKNAPLIQNPITPDVPNLRYWFHF